MTLNSISFVFNLRIVYKFGWNIEFNNVHMIIKTDDDTFSDKILVVVIFFSYIRALMWIDLFGLEKA